ncbi:MAG: ATP-binding protein [Deltaproteobacteria bacterium]|nr:ATP-binding protein [Deltaproteobacteria bacterium]
MPRYRPRHAEPQLREMAGFFKAVLVVGARQVGKTTLLDQLFLGHRKLVFDPIQDLYAARADPELFLDSFPPPLILDEIQYAPEVLPALKRRLDRMEQPGQYLLTGSQNLAVLRAVAESMAGRVGVLHLEGMSAAEMRDEGREQGWLAGYLDHPAELLDVVRQSGPAAGPLNLMLWRGSLPGLLEAPDSLVPVFYRSYVETYVQRDVRTMEEIRDVASFDRFLGLAAALTAQEINASQLGREIGIVPSTARRWLNLLLHTYQWHELAPYHGNVVKRLSGKRKGYLADTGLASYLQRISSPQALAVSPLLGALFETWVMGEIRKQFVQLAVPPQAWHWRTGGGAEVDLVLERDGLLYPIEVKCKSSVDGRDARGILAFRETYGEGRVMPGLVVFAGTSGYKLGPHALALPWNAVRASPPPLAAAGGTFASGLPRG